VSFFSFFTTNFERIPASFWGVIAGGFLTFLGIYFTNRASATRLREQFAHEHTIKSKEREMGVKKEVYLAAAEAIAAAQTAVHNFADLELESFEVTADYRAKAPALAKIYVVGKSDSIKGLLHFNGGLNPIFLALGAIRQKLNAEKQAIEYLKNSYAEASTNRARYLEVMQKYNLDVLDDKLRWDAVNRAFDYEQKKCVELEAQRVEKVKTFYPQHLAFIAEVNEHSIQVGQLALPLLAAVRSDLELPLNIEEIRPLIEGNGVAQRAAIAKFTATLASQNGFEVDQKTNG
jgi:hypothetical protein